MLQQCSTTVQLYTAGLVPHCIKRVEFQRMSSDTDDSLFGDLPVGTQNNEETFSNFNLATDAATGGGGDSYGGHAPPLLANLQLPDLRSLHDVFVDYTKSGSHYESKLREFVDNHPFAFWCGVSLDDSHSARLGITCKTSFTFTVGEDSDKKVISLSLRTSSDSKIDASVAEMKVLKDAVVLVCNEVDQIDDREAGEMRMEYLDNVYNDPGAFLARFDFGSGFPASRNFQNKQGFIDSLTIECTERHLTPEKYGLVNGDYERARLETLIRSMVSSLNEKLMKVYGISPPTSDLWKDPVYAKVLPRNPYGEGGGIMPRDSMFDHLDEGQRKRTPNLIKEVLKNFRVICMTPEISQRPDVQASLNAVLFLENQPVVQCKASNHVFLFVSITYTLYSFMGILLPHLLECEQVSSEVKAELGKLRPGYSRQARALGWSTTILSESTMDIVKTATGQEYAYTPIVLDFDEMIAVNVDAMLFGYNHLGYESKDGHRNYTPCLEIYARRGMQDLISTLAQITRLHGKSSERRLFSLEFFVKLFKEKTAYTDRDGTPVDGVDLHKFRADLQAYYDSRGLNQFINLSFLFTMRYLQRACAKCGCSLINKRDVLCDEIAKHSDVLVEALNNEVAEIPNGGYGESDHIKKNKQEEGHKDLELCVRDVRQVRFESVVREVPHTSTLCDKCHNRCGVGKQFKDLPTEPACEYARIAPQLFCRVLNGEAAASISNMTRELIEKDDLKMLDFATVEARMKGAQEGLVSPPYHISDTLGGDEAYWRSASSDVRRYMLRRQRTSFMKRLSGGCFLCHMDFSIGPFRELMGMDAHHEVEAKKKFSPSHGINYDMETEDDEFCKCVPLCRTCHLFIHSSEVARNILRTRMTGQGYITDEISGKISHSG